jgi:hypothetical protein
MRMLISSLLLLNNENAYFLPVPPEQWECLFPPYSPWTMRMLISSPVQGPGATTTEIVKCIVTAKQINESISSASLDTKTKSQIAHSAAIVHHFWTRAHGPCSRHVMMKTLQLNFTETFD